MPTWFWFSPTSMAICRFGTASAARSTMRARCATRRDTCSPCALRSNSRRSSFVIRSAGTIRIALPQPFGSPVPHTPTAVASAHRRRAERLDEARLVLFEPAEADHLLLDHLDELVNESFCGVRFSEAGAEPRRQPEDPDEPLHPQDGRQRPDLA